MYPTNYTGGDAEKMCLWNAKREQAINEAQEKVVCPCPWISFTYSVQKNIPHVVWKGKLSDCDFLTPAYYLWSIFCFDLEVVYLEHILLLLCRLLITKVALCQDFWPGPSGHHWPDLIDRNMSNFLSRYVPFGELWKLLSLFVSKFYSIFGIGISDESQSAFDIWKGNVHSFLEPPSDCWVKSPG